MHPAADVKKLDFWFDANFSFADHVRNICKTYFIQMNGFRRVRQYLTDEVAILATNALVIRLLDYCTTLFRSLSSFIIIRCTNIPWQQVEEEDGGWLLGASGD